MSPNNDFIVHLKKLEKEQMKRNLRQKEIRKTRMEIHKQENIKAIQKANAIKRWPSQKINKIGKTPKRLNRKIETKITIIRKEKMTSL